MGGCRFRLSRISTQTLDQRTAVAFIITFALRGIVVFGRKPLARAPFAYRWEETGCNFASVTDTRPAGSHFNAITYDSLISFWSLVQCHGAVIIGGCDTGGEVCDHVNFMVTGALNLLARFVTLATRLMGATSAQLAGPVRA
jgi:hypothetical protein